MSNLIKFILSSRIPILVDPRFIRNVQGNNIETIVTVDSKDENGEYITHVIPKSIKEVTEIIEDKFKEIKEDQNREAGNQVD